ncbi:MAG: glycosyl hydrolase family 28 protein [bacterium]
MSSKQNPVIYTVPVEEIPAVDYAVTVNGQPVFTHQARVSAYPLNQVWPGYQRSKSQTEIASFASWEMSGSVDVDITSNRPVKSVVVRPQSAGIAPHVDGDTISFTINEPGQFSVEVNGSHRALLLFANPAEEHIPNPADSSVLYFGPGVHCPGLINMTSNQTVYIAGGAVVYGAIVAEHATNIAILGRGILDGSKFDRMQLNGLVSTYNCKNVRIEGITLRDPSGWTIVPVASSHVYISNIKIIGNWRYNTDGIDFVNCQHCVIEDSFIRSYDDSICLKGYDNWGPFIYKLQLYKNQFDGYFTIDGINRQSFADLQRQQGIYACNAAPMHDFQVRRCVLWNDWGRAMEIGLETVAAHISDIHFEDCDIIHTNHVAMDIQNGDNAYCHNITFKDIRVELDDCPPPQYQSTLDQEYSVSNDNNYLPCLITLHIIQGYCNYSEERGHIDNISFEDIIATAPGIPPSHFIGFDVAHLVQKITIKNLQINGQAAVTPESAGIQANEFVRDVVIV